MKRQKDIQNRAEDNATLELGRNTSLTNKVLFEKNASSVLHE